MSASSSLGNQPHRSQQKHNQLPWVVQCFNGDLIRTSARKIGSELIANQRTRFRTALVCLSCVKLHSDPSRQLLQMLRSANHVQDSRIPSFGTQGQNLPWIKSNTAAADLLLLEYTNIARGLGIDSILLGNLVKEVESNCKWLRWLIAVSEASGKWLPKLHDITHAMNEKLATLILCYALVDQGFHPQIILAEDVDATITLDSNGTPVVDSFTKALTEKVKAAHPRIPIVTGRLAYDTMQRSPNVGFATSLAILLCRGLHISQYHVWSKNNYVVSATAYPIPPSSGVTMKSQHPSSAPSTPKPTTTSPSIRAKLSNRSTSSLASASSRSSSKPVPTPPSPAPLKNQLSLPEIKPLRPRRSLHLLSAPATATNPPSHPPIPPVTITNTTSAFQTPRAPKIVLRDSIFTISITPLAGIPPLRFSKAILEVLDRFGVVPSLMTTCGHTRPQTCIAVDSNEWAGSVTQLLEELDHHGDATIHYGLSIISILGDPTSSPIRYDHIVVPMAKCGVRTKMVGGLDDEGGGEGFSMVISTNDAGKAVRALKQVITRV